MSELNLPGSSFDELTKIIQAYGHFTEKASGEEVGKVAGVHRTTISRNSKFLVDIGVLTTGAQKSATDLGQRLARALEHNVTEDIRKYWGEAISQNEEFSKLVTTLRIKGGMTEKAFSDHILYVSGAKKSKPAETGARTIVDVLLAAGMINEADGNLHVSAGSSTHAEPSKPTNPSSGSAEPTRQEEILAGEHTIDLQAPDSIVSINPNPQVTINIQLQIPEATDPETYNQLFEALAKNLFPPKNAS